MTCHLRSIMFGFVLLGTCLVQPGTTAAAPIVITTGKVEGAAGREVTVPISIKGVKEVNGVSCLTARLTYDPAMLTFKSIEKGPKLPNAFFDKSIDEKADPGLIGFGFACGSKEVGGKEMASVTDDGVVLKVLFTVNDKATIGQKSPLKLDNYRALDNAEPPFEVQVHTEEGEFKVTGGGLPANFLMWILIALGAVLFLVLLIVLLRRGKKEEPYRPAPGYAPPPGANVPRFTPESPTFTHTCTKCAGVIQLPRAMMGQSFQCGACGTMQIGRGS